ncbi:nucleolar protein 16-like [Rhopilema esculentum]|uniref:nucleolar protein 16-like n=1 Tax=Rhopilema esculentum TaxID=499914 RepID=UPI0031D58D93
MGGVRARKSRRNKIVNDTKVANKRKKRNFKVAKVTSKVIKDHWDDRKTLKQNFKSIGLAMDPNDACKKTTLKVKKISKKATDSDIAMECEDTVVVQKLKEEASHISKKERLVSPGEAQFILTLRDDYGEDYKAMARDKRNYQQHTPNQLRRKFEAFFRSSYYKKYTSSSEVEKG